LASINRDPYYARFMLLMQIAKPPLPLRFRFRGRQEITFPI